MTSKNYRILWLLTAFAVVLLLAGTIYLSSEAREREGSGFTAYVTSAGTVVYLRQTPDYTAHIVTILEAGQMVYVTNRFENDRFTWYHATTGEHRGWIPAERLSVDPPSPDS